MHVGNRNKQSATKNMWVVTGNAPRSVRPGQPRSTRNICFFFFFFHYFPHVQFFCLMFFLLFFFIAVFYFFGAYFYCLSVFSLVYLLQILFFFVSLFFSLFFSFSLPPFVNVLRNPLLYLDWSFLFVSQKMFVFKRNMTHVFKLSLFFTVLSVHST